MKLEQKIVEIAKFKSQYAAALNASVRNEFSNLVVSEATETEIDWQYLITCASVLALSDSEGYREIALRISTAVLSLSDDKSLRVAATLMLNRLANKPSTDLAIRKGLIKKEDLKALSPSLSFDKLRSDFRNSVLTSKNELLHLNGFQRELFGSTTIEGWLSVSAPTSAGKSFILEHFVEEYLATNQRGNVCFVVPTRALISEVESEFITRITAKRIQNIYLSSVPQLPPSWQSQRLLMILTQERLSWLLSAAPDEFCFDFIVFDEAQKISDSYRGIVLQEALESALSRNRNCRVLFASPQTKNPELLLKYKPSQLPEKVVLSDYQAVSQNLIWVQQPNSKQNRWDVKRFEADLTPVTIGTFTSNKLPKMVATNRLPYIANAIGGGSGVLIYANYAYQAELMSEFLYSQLPEIDSVSKPLSALIKMAKSAVHKEYLLAKVLTKGIGFHYGNMPTALRIEIESQFKLGRIKTLICTGTLIEGVNIGARSVFIRGPRRGKKKNTLSLVDFWNLAGRAGRLGSDFNGNIVCVDAEDDAAWDFRPPLVKEKIEIREASNLNPDSLEELISFIDRGTPREDIVDNPFLDYALTFFCRQLRRDGTLLNSNSAPTSRVHLKKLEVQIAALMDKVSIPESVYLKHSISPLAQQSLLNYFRTKERADFERLIPKDPNDREEAFESYTKINNRIFTHLSGDYSKLAPSRAVLIISWMRGLPLPLIIENNINYWKKKSRKKSVAATIRETMADIEEFARFKFARYSACYLDILRHHFKEAKATELMSKVPDLQIWLEFGSSEKTQISLMSLGLSRNAAINFSKKLDGKELDREQCIEAIKMSNLSMIRPKIVREEIGRIKQMLLEAL